MARDRASLGHFYRINFIKFDRAIGMHVLEREWVHVGVCTDTEWICTYVHEYKYER